MLLLYTTELVAAEEQELNVIQSYMPAQLGNLLSFALSITLSPRVPLSHGQWLYQ